MSDLLAVLGPAQGVLGGALVHVVFLAMRGLLTALKEKAKKTPSPLDDQALEVVSTVVDAVEGPVTQAANRGDGRRMPR